MSVHASGGAGSINSAILKPVSGGATHPTGAELVELQKALKAAGYDVGKHGADGIWGHDTKNALIAFQKATFGTGNGVFDAKTATALKAKIATQDTATVTGGVQPKPNPVTTYPTGAAGGPAPTRRIDDQLHVMGEFFGMIGESLKQAGISILHPIATNEIEGKAWANVIKRYETEVPQKPLSQIMNEEGQKATAAINALGSHDVQTVLHAYDQAISAGNQALDWTSNTASSIAAGTVSAYNTSVNFVENAPHNIRVGTAHTVGGWMHNFGNWLAGGGKSLEDDK